MNPYFGGGACPQCGRALPGTFQQGWMGAYPAGPVGMPMTAPPAGFWGYPYAPTFQGWGPTWTGGFGPQAMGYGLGGLRRWGGTYTPQYASTGLPTDEEIVEMIYDAFDADPLVPWDADIDVSVEAGTVTLAGTVPNKRIKHAAGDDAWWIPGVTDVQNNLEVTGRHRGRGAPAPEAEKPAEQAGARRRPMRG